MLFCVGDFQLVGCARRVGLAGIIGLRGLWQDDAELAGGQEASGSRAPVLKSALVSSCRIGCAQSSNINSSNTTVYAVRYLHAQVWGVVCAFSCRLCADGAYLLMLFCVGDFQDVCSGNQDDAELAGVLESSPSTVALLNTATRVVLPPTTSPSTWRRYDAQFVWRLCADGAHLLMLFCVGDFQKVGCARGVRLAGVRAFREVLQDDAELAGVVPSVWNVDGSMTIRLEWFEHAHMG
ncbi:hypothetical protein cyc_08122 [Cyclospora cayetanensis]|uniref:Uncharacterized protein n=1 Tax=Cyclospora cayetanensis TaxID=88456 RepID=A0A1D3CX58_9EIME|nr:hypothetical protein cyc_08122 [Cyclospora cayetanensis]